MWKNGTLQTDNIRIQVLNNHIHYPEEWVMHCRELGIQGKSLSLSADEPEEEAQGKALKIVRSTLIAMLDDATLSLIGRLGDDEIDHTPGPWRIDNHPCVVECGSKEANPSTHQRIEVHHHLFVLGETAKAKANAQLIKSSPDMYQFIYKAARLDEVTDPEEYQQCAFLLNQHAKELVFEISSNV